MSLVKEFEHSFKAISSIKDFKMATNYYFEHDFIDLSFKPLIG